MNKIRIVMLFLTLYLATTTGAWALSNYNYTDTLRLDGLTLHSRETLELNYEGVDPSQYFTKAILTLRGSATHPLYFPTALIGVSTLDPDKVLYAGTLVFNERNVANLSLNVAALNRYLLKNPWDDIRLNLVVGLGDVTLTKATLKGTVAPEPASMALVAAGLVGLPFVRRCRKAIGS
ncbi:PEP-CTERM sorting domain-containing protein [Geobacter sp.]|uniref:PEP-CTERM sorting domain-containing protein n=1 Tax=Geobacter sp. TaxID=46610 RepID=UPI00261BF4D3|nr:PEP-CTERM sorting domain-containing protein [Geobacter sp.]